MNKGYTRHNQKAGERNRNRGFFSQRVNDYSTLGSAIWHRKAPAYQAGVCCHSFLGTELELDRRAHPLGLLSVMAGILPDDGRAGLLAHWKFIVHAQSAQVCGIISHFRARLVDL